MPVNTYRDTLRMINFKSKIFAVSAQRHNYCPAIFLQNPAG